MISWPSGRASGHRGQHGDGVAVLDRGFQTAEEPYVLVVQVHVHEPAQPAVGDQPVLEPGVATVDVIDELGQRGALALYLLRAIRVGAQDRRDTNVDGHQTLHSVQIRGMRRAGSGPLSVQLGARRDHSTSVISTGSSVITSSVIR